MLPPSGWSSLQGRPIGWETRKPIPGLVKNIEQRKQPLHMAIFSTITRLSLTVHCDGELMCRQRHQPRRRPFRHGPPLQHPVQQGGSLQEQQQQLSLPPPCAQTRMPAQPRKTSAWRCRRWLGRAVSPWAFLGQLGWWLPLVPVLRLGWPLLPSPADVSCVKLTHD